MIKELFLEQNIFFLFFIFGYGATIGSFLNCIIYRLQQNKSFFKGRSYCPHCKHILSWKDLIPIFSFFILKGKCRYCQNKISFQYPLVEIFTGLLFIAIFWHVKNIIFTVPGFLYFCYLLFICCCLIVIFVYDLKHYLIPDNILSVAILTTIFWFFLSLIFKVSTLAEIKRAILSAIFPSLFFLALILISKEKWMGWGDFKLSILMGIFLGWPKILFSLFFAFFIGGIVAIFLVILGKKKMKSEIPLGPFLVSGTFFALFFGEKIIYWYLEFFLWKN